MLTDPAHYRPAGARLPLARFPYLDTADPAVARAEVARLFAPHRLEVAAHGGRFRAFFNHARLHRLSIYFARYEPEIVISSAPMDGLYIFLLPLAGACWISTEDGEVEVSPGQVFVVNPFAPLRMHWVDNCAQIVAKIEREELERAVASHLGHPPIEPVRFDDSRALQQAECGTLVSLLDLIFRDLEEDGSTVGSRLGEQPAETLFLHMLLRQFPNNYAETLKRPASRAAPYYVKRVEEFIRLYAAKPIRLDDMVAVSGVSARALFKGFRNFRGVGPMAYLKAVRLDHVHAELGTDPPPGKPRRTVSEVAEAWGFNHLGNFAKDYKRRFGERPSDTLRNRGG